MRIVIMSCVVILSGLTACTGLRQWADEQNAAQQRERDNRQNMLDQMTPDQRGLYLLEERRVQIDQQRANTEQIESGLRMMQSAQPTFTPMPPPPGAPTRCVSQQRYYGGSVETVCN